MLKVIASSLPVFVSSSSSLLSASLRAWICPAPGSVGGQFCGERRSWLQFSRCHPRPSFHPRSRLRVRIGSLAVGEDDRATASIVLPALAGLRRGRAYWVRLIRALGARERPGGMFSLLYGLWKYLFSKAEFHVLILGIDKAGKTTLLEKLKTLYSDVEGLPSDRIVPTVGLNIGRVEAHKSKLIFWDLGGQLGLRVIWEKYYEEAHAVVYVVDSASKTRFEDTKSALDKVMRHPDLQGAPLLVFANKQDLPEAVNAEELARYLQLKEQKSIQSRVQGISAHEGSGIQEGVLWLVEAMRNNKRTEQLKRHAEAAVSL